MMSSDKSLPTPVEYFLYIFVAIPTMLLWGLMLLAMVAFGVLAVAGFIAVPLKLAGVI